MTIDESHAAEHLAALAETTPDAFVTIDTDSRIQFANEAIEDVLGYAPADLIGESLTVLMPAGLRDQHLEAVDRYLATGERALDWEYLELPGEHRDGHEVPLAVTFSEFTLDGDRYFTGVLRDISERKRRADQLERLNELGRTLPEVETFDEACEQIIAAARDVLSLPVTCVHRYDADAARLEPWARASGIDDLAGDDPLFAADRDVAWEAFAQNETVVQSTLEQPAADGTVLSSVVVVPIGKHGVFVGGTSEPDAFSETTLSLARLLAKNAASAFDRLEREVALREQKSQLESKNEQLRRVEHVNQQIRDITEALIDAESSAEIKRLVCDRLATIEPYQFVWFGERDRATDEVTPAAWAGVEDGYLDAVTISTDGNETDRNPAGKAIHTSEPQLQNNLQSDPPFDQWRQEALDRGYRACMSIPVVYRDTLYGLLTLYGNEPGVFTELEQAVLVELGEMIGYALNAMERYNALVADDSIELEFVMRDLSEALLRFLRAEESEFRFENIGSHEGGKVRVFGVFEGVSFDRVESFAGRCGSVEDVTLVRERDGEVIVELLLASDAFLAGLLSRGAVPTDVRAGPEEARMTVRISRSASVREFVEYFETHYDEVELVARRQAPDPVKTSEEFERAYLDQLTERQEDVLRTAYFSGFFEQPRGSSASDVAESLGVSQPTVSRHIRSGEEQLFSMLFGDDEPV